jgi:pimeloyl-ACP methyl ester carboxylesterase/DNA-binding CsgD family transcriptional regulator
VNRFDSAPPPLTASAQLLRRAWGRTSEAPSPEARLVDEMLTVDEEAGFAFGSAALVPQEAVAIAVLSARNAVAEADAAFARAFPDPGAIPDLRRLAERARRTGSALGLLEAADGTPVPAWMARGPAAARWVRTPQALAALARPDAVVVLVFAPSRSGDLAARASAAFGLTPLEARLAEAFLFAPTLEIAAAQAGIGHATARDVLARVMSKTGASRSGEVVRRLVEVMGAVHNEARPTAALVGEALGLTAAEAGVALALAAGATQREAATALGLRPETVRTYAKAVLAKAGVPRAKDLARLVAETRALSSLVAVAEPVFTSGAQAARLRLLPRPGGRRLAFLDYGPPSAEPAIIFHGFVAGRSLPPRLAAALQARGLRPIVPQRPGFGLTAPAAAGAYLATAADDLEALVAALGAIDVALLARDGGTAAALAFAAAHPKRITRGVLLNPRSPQGLTPGHRSGPVKRMTRLILEQPHLIAGLGELIRRRTRSDFLEAALSQTLKAIPQDREALGDRAVRAQLIRDIQAQFAHTSAGYAAEHALYAEGWRVPEVAGGGPWTLVHAGALGEEPPGDPWRALPGAHFHTLGGAGVLAQFTHAEALAELIAG